MKIEIGVLARVACLAMLSMQAEGVTLVHDERGRFVGQPPRILDTDGVRVCVPPHSRYSLVIKGREVSDPSVVEVGKREQSLKLLCWPVPTPGGNDAMLRYSIERPDVGVNEPSPCRPSAELINAYVEMNAATSGWMPEGVSLFEVPTGPSCEAFTKALASDAKKLERLASSLAGRGGARRLARALPTLSAMGLYLEDHKSRVDRSIVEGASKAKRKRAFSGEFPVGRYRRAVLFDEKGAYEGGVTSLSLPLRQLDQILFYAQRVGGTDTVYSVSLEEKEAFRLDPAKSSSDDADWVIERIGEAATFKGSANLKVIFERIQGEKKETVRTVSIPVLESYHWQVTTGFYSTNMVRHSYYLTTGTNAVGSTPAGPARVERDESTGGVNAAAFLTFYPRARTVKPGAPLSWDFLTRPGLVIGARLDAPLKETLLGIAFEPVRGLQVIVGGVKGTRPELGKNVSLGSPLNGTFAAVPTVDRRSPTYHFFALAIDLKPLGDGLTKLLGKL